VRGGDKKNAAHPNTSNAIKKSKCKTQGLQHIKNVNKVIEAKIKWVHIGCFCVYMHAH